jgi:hypothetical protein
MPMRVRAPSQCPYRSGMEEPTESQSRRTGMRARPAFLFLTALALVSCNDSSPTPTRLVGAHRLALAVPADWETEVQHGSFCPPVDPATVEFFTPLQPWQGVGSCAVPIGTSWPAENSVSIYTKATGGGRTPDHPPSGTVHGLPYFVSDSRQSGPGVALTLSVPEAGVSFLVGAADREAAMDLLATIHYVPAGTPLR